MSEFDRNLGREDREGECQYLRAEIDRLRAHNVELLAILRLYADATQHDLIIDGGRRARTAIAKAEGK